MAVPKTRTSFGGSVRSILERNKAEGRKPDSIRSLARVMGAGDEARASVAKRNLNRWVSGGITPLPESRHAVAVALGVGPEQLADDDEEEGDPLVALMNAIRRVVQSEMKEST